MKSFRTYQMAVQFYRSTRQMRLPGHLRSQLDRAASSICLNLAEGQGRIQIRDKLRFYRIAFGSVRECQSILDLVEDNRLADDLDHIAACLYKLIKVAA